VPLAIREAAAGQAARDAPADDASLTVVDLPGLVDRTVLLGDPGGGKSTACSVLMDHLARDPQARVPFLVLLRELYRPGRPRKEVARHIEATLASRHHCRPPRGLVERILREGSAFVIFEGLDEVLDIPGRRAAALCIEQFCHAYPGARVLVTSRGEAYGQGRLDPGVFTRYALGDFGREEAAEYVRRWFRWHGQPAPAVSGFPGEGTYDVELRSSPLLLSLVCTLYHETGVLPRDRVDLYEQCTDMLIRIRDEAKEIRRELKAEVLIRPLIQHLALWMLSLPDANAPVAENDLTREVERFLRDNTPGPAGGPRAPAEEFVEFCRERAWVLSSVPSPGGEERVQVHSPGIPGVSRCSRPRAAGEDTRSPRDGPGPAHNHPLLALQPARHRGHDPQHPGDGRPDVRAAAPPGGLARGPWGTADLPYDAAQGYRPFGRYGPRPDPFDPPPQDRA
jgi:NACHT domain